MDKELLAPPGPPDEAPAGKAPTSPPPPNWASDLAGATNLGAFVAVDMPLSPPLPPPRRLRSRLLHLPADDVKESSEEFAAHVPEEGSVVPPARLPADAAGRSTGGAGFGAMGRYLDMIRSAIEG